MFQKTYPGKARFLKYHHFSFNINRGFSFCRSAHCRIFPCHGTWSSSCTIHSCTIPFKQNLNILLIGVSGSSAVGGTGLMIVMMPDPFYQAFSHIWLSEKMRTKSNEIMMPSSVEYIKQEFEQKKDKV